MSAPTPSRLEQRLTDDHRLVRIAVIVFGGMAALILFGLGAREFHPDQCANQAMERRATEVESVDGGCRLTFEDGSVEVFEPSVWAGYSLAAAVAIVLATAVYAVVSRGGDR